MKSPATFFCILILALGARQAASGQTLTFDDLPANPYTLGVPEGYGGLQWDGFGVINGSLYPNSGYSTGMISPNNVLFDDDEFNRVAFITNRTAFNLVSAFLTSQVVLTPGMYVQVEGFVGSRLAYNDVYLLSNITPLFVNFNYIGVDRVEFIPEAPGFPGPDNALIFAMDNLTVSGVPEPDSCMIFCAGAALTAFGALRKKLENPGEPELFATERFGYRMVVRQA